MRDARLTRKGYHQACYPSFGPSWWCQAYLRPHLRGDSRRPQDLPRERHSRLGHLHRTRQAQDCHLSRRRLRAQAPGPYPLRFRRLGGTRRVVLSSSSSILYLAFEPMYLCVPRVVCLCLGFDNAPCSQGSAHAVRNTSASLSSDCALTPHNTYTPLRPLGTNYLYIDNTSV